MSTRIPADYTGDISIYQRGSNPVVLDILGNAIGREYQYKISDISTPRGDSSLDLEYRTAINSTRKLELYTAIAIDNDAVKNAGLRVIDIASHVAYLSYRYAATNQDSRSESDEIKQSVKAVSSLFKLTGAIGYAMAAAANVYTSIQLERVYGESIAKDAERIRKINIDALQLRKEAETLKLEYDLDGIEANKKLAAALEANGRSANLETYMPWLVVGAIALIVYKRLQA